MTIVLPATVDDALSTASFLPPKRRCKLYEISDKTLTGIKATEIPNFQEFKSDMPFIRAPRFDPFRREGLSMPARTSFDNNRQPMDSYMGRRSIQGNESTAWSVRDGRWSGLQINVGTLREFKRTENDEKSWVKTCANRLLGSKYEDEREPEPCNIPVSYRVCS